MKQAISGTVLYLILIIPPVVSFLESMMILHMLVQLPLLILSGWLIGKVMITKYKSLFNKWNKDGVPGIMLVVFITIYWMLPRSLDEALTITVVELFKFVSLPLLVGISLRDSWGKLQSLGKSFIYLNYLSMFGFMAWLYIDTPIQICNNYLEIQQRVLGWGFLVLTAAMALYIIQMVFTDHSEST
ncbi:hypothetical protein ACFQ3N_10750 [Virgibacillus byunsanensis]|uniref:Uncharacterized protein n=1 Tax=Virgibacillus byunsanensis TaxID=570945 RepID=A0ABW3LM24_9BACI